MNPSKHPHVVLDGGRIASLPVNCKGQFDLCAWSHRCEPQTENHRTNAICLMDGDTLDGLMAMRQHKGDLWRPDPIVWQKSDLPQDYSSALLQMEYYVANIAAGSAPERLWLLEHPALYTAGTSAKVQDLVDPDRFPVYETGRGGQYTYHGPGQRVGYVMLNLVKRGGDVRAFVAALEQWLIDTLAHFGIQGERRVERVGIWVQHNGGESKIAAIGIRVRRGVTFHGVSLNVDPDLSHFEGIVPCGITEHGVTSLAKLGVKASMAEVDQALVKTFQPIFGPIK